VARGPQPFPWRSLRRADRRTTQLISSLAAWAAVRATRVEVATPLGPLGVRGGRADVLVGPDLARALSDPTSAVALVRARGATTVAYVVASGALTRGLARAILGGDDELDAPRVPTPAERGVVTYAVAAWLASASAPQTAFAEPSESAGPLLAAELGEAAVIELEVDGACSGWAALVVPLALAMAAPRRGPLAPPRAAWGDEPVIDGAIAIGAVRTARALAVRDVIVLGARSDAAALRIGGGAIAVAVAADGNGVIVRGAYARTDMSEPLADDATVEVVACVGEVTLSVRQLLELAPGQILTLGKPVGGEVELRVGRQRLGRGELVDVDGEVGVRVLEIEGGRTG